MRGAACDVVVAAAADDTVGGAGGGRTVSGVVGIVLLLSIDILRFRAARLFPEPLWWVRKCCMQLSCLLNLAAQPSSGHR